MLWWGTESSLFHRVPGDREPRRTGNNTGGSLEDILGNNKVNTQTQVSTNGVGLLFRVVNRTMSVRERGSYASADEGLQV